MLEMVAEQRSRDLEVFELERVLPYLSSTIRARWKSGPPFQTAMCGLISISVSRYARLTQKH